MARTGMNPRYSQKHELTGTSIFISECRPVSHSPKCPLQPEKLAQHIDKNENVFCHGYCKGQFERQVLSALHGNQQRNRAFFIEVWSKAWSILHRCIILPTSLTKILWWVCSSSWSYFYSILNFTVRLCLQVAKERMLRGKRRKKILCLSEGAQLFGKYINHSVLSTRQQEIRAVWNSN